MSDIASEADVAFVRRETVAAAPPPVSEAGAAGWLRANLFSSPLNSVLTVLSAVFAAYAIWNVANWAVVRAVWTGENRTACTGPDVGACWAFIRAKFAQLMYGRYPLDERWRVNLTGLLFLAAFVPTLIPSAPFKRETVFFLLIPFPVIAFVLLTGKLGLRPVPTDEWGGLMLTLVVAVVSITLALPFGILLALGRRSRMPVIRAFCVGFIELWRGVPLITVLFMANVMLPLFLPPGTNFDRLLRALVGVTMFSSAYMAEVVRGGLQAIPRGQYEGAGAMGLGYWQMMRLIILPQALKLVIPGIVNTFIGLFKDTTLVTFVALFDVLGTIQANIDDQNWVTPATAPTGFIFAAAVFWVFCFGMSRYSLFMERRLDTRRR